MKEYEVGHSWDIPEGYTETGRIGGYIIATKDNMLYIIGKRIFNLSESPILPACVIPFTGSKIAKVESDLEVTFKYDPDTLYYGVHYGSDGSVFVFKDMLTASYLLNFFIEFKASSLLHEISERKKDKKDPL